MSTRFTVFIVIFIAIVFFASQSIFIVTEQQRGVLLRFGEVERADIAPGLHFMIPFVNKVRKFDGRLMSLDTNAQEYITSEKKAVVVDSYVMWRIADVESFYTATSGDELTARRLLTARVDTGLRNQFGERTLFEVVSGQRDELMQDLTLKIGDITRNELGISVVDIRVKRINLPQSVSRSVFDRMITERQRLARELRAQGLEEAEEIRARADKERQIIEADAVRDADVIRGEGDARAASIYAGAYNRFPDFYQFNRTLNAYISSFSNPEDLLILHPEGEFFRYLK